MKKYEEEHYKFENIKTKIYPWVKSELKDTLALNGKHFSEKYSSGSRTRTSRCRCLDTNILFFSFLSPFLSFSA